MKKNTNKAKDRFYWALDIVNPDSSDIVLEVGCGTGILVERLAASLTEGKVVAVDRSASMIKAATKRNSRYIENKTAQFYGQDYSTLVFTDHMFDKAIAFNVRALWQSPTKYLPLLHGHLKPNGRLYLFHQPAVNNTQDLVKNAEEVFLKNGFRIKEINLKEWEPVPAFCIVALPNKNSKTVIEH